MYSEQWHRGTVAGSLKFSLSHNFLHVGKFSSKNTKFWAENLTFCGNSGAKYG